MVARCGCDQPAVFGHGAWCVNGSDMPSRVDTDLIYDRIVARSMANLAGIPVAEQRIAGADKAPRWSGNKLPELARRKIAGIFGAG